MAHIFIQTFIMEYGIPENQTTTCQTFPHLTAWAEKQNQSD